MRASPTTRANFRGSVLFACTIAAIAVPALAADDLCGRPRETPEALFNRLTKTEKLPEAFRDKAYVTINDAAKATIWSFTVAGHPAHPAVVCRHPVETGGKLSIDMGIQCGASDDACEQLARGFEGLNAKLLKDAESKAQ
ncbi:MAG TPA: hypothetical protein VFZ16_04420 [Hyphomicrobiaceae bacterium]|nr:hypothetical protein [Hyphomicrobiaceae bacterium]